MHCLVTGAKSGLGYAIASNFPGRRLTREDSLADLRAEKFDVIFHCAFNAAKEVRIDNISTYVADNLFLTQRLLGLHFDKFVYISSADLYPRSLRHRQEGATYDVGELYGVYPFVKLFSELAIRERWSNYLILRPVTMLGPIMRPNTTSRILKEREPQLFLHSDSRFNYILHRDIVQFLWIAIERDLTGVFNIASHSTLRLGDICSDLGLRPRFGEYVYDIGDVANERAAVHYPGFNKSSAKVLNSFIDELGDAFVGRGRVVERA